MNSRSNLFCQIKMRCKKPPQKNKNKPRFNVLKCWCHSPVSPFLLIICFHSTATPENRTAAPRAAACPSSCRLFLTFRGLRLSGVKHLPHQGHPSARGSRRGAGGHAQAATWVPGWGEALTAPCGAVSATARGPTTPGPEP